MHHYQRLEKHPGSPSEQRGYIVAEKENASMQNHGGLQAAGMVSVYYDSP
jgi:hypothetical protein